MSRTSTARFLIAGIAAVAMSVLTPAAALATSPVADDCPAGFTLLSVPVLTAQGYKVPALVDGNGDGWVCGVAMGNQTTSWGGQLYNFMDNTLPAAG